MLDQQLHLELLKTLSLFSFHAKVINSKRERLIHNLNLANRSNSVAIHQIFGVKTMDVIIDIIDKITDYKIYYIPPFVITDDEEEIRKMHKLRTETMAKLEKRLNEDELAEFIKNLISKIEKTDVDYLILKLDLVKHLNIYLTEYLIFDNCITQFIKFYLNPVLVELTKIKSIINKEISEKIDALHQMFQPKEQTSQNTTVSEFCQQMGITEAQFYGKEQIQGDLDWENLEYLPEGICLDVKGYIYLRRLKELPPNSVLKSTEWIELSNLTVIPENCNLSAGLSLYLDALTELGQNCSLNAGRNLCLRSLTLIPRHCTVDVKGEIY